MNLRLFHISEEEDIRKFIPRISKEQWSYEKYVWAIAEEKLQNYLFPRECPRICVDLEKTEVLNEWLSLTKTGNRKSIIFVAEDWEERIQNCILFKYEFDKQNFKLIDSIAGYYVSDKTEVSTRKFEINNCIRELNTLNTELVITSKKKMIEIK